MNKNLVVTAKWILVFGGFFWAYEGITGTDLVERIFGGLEPVIDVILFGGAAAILAYKMATSKK